MQNLVCFGHCNIYSLKEIEGFERKKSFALVHLDSVHVCEMVEFKEEEKTIYVWCRIFRFIDITWMELLIEVNKQLCFHLYNWSKFMDNIQFCSPIKGHSETKLKSKSICSNINIRVYVSKRLHLVPTEYLSTLCLPIE